MRALAFVKADSKSHSMLILWGDSSKDGLKIRDVYKVVGDECIKSSVEDEFESIEQLETCMQENKDSISTAKCTPSELIIALRYDLGDKIANAVYTNLLSGELMEDRDKANSFIAYAVNVTIDKAKKYVEEYALTGNKKIRRKEQ